jgi:hypothetical protein
MDCVRSGCGQSLSHGHGANLGVPVHRGTARGPSPRPGRGGRAQASAGARASGTVTDPQWPSLAVGRTGPLHRARPPPGGRPGDRGRPGPGYAVTDGIGPVQVLTESGCQSNFGNDGTQ